MIKYKKIFLDLLLHLGQDRDLCVGVHRYVAEHECPWDVFPTPQQIQNHHEVCAQIAKWEVDGCIGFVDSAETDAIVAGMPFPFVNVWGNMVETNQPSVGVDYTAIGCMAARYLMELHPQHMAVVYRSRYKNDRRAEGFCAEAARLGMTPTRLVISGSIAEGDNTLQQLLSMPRPVAVFAVDDGLGRSVCKFCHRANLLVPDEVAVLGSNDDALHCEASHPPLSSVAWPAVKAGYLAAQMLDSMMRGEPRPTQPVLLQPTHVEVRRSTNVLGVADPVVAKALRIIRARAVDGLKVTQLAKHFSISRRSLEMKFKTTLRRTLHQEIRRVQIEAVKQALWRTDATLDRIASECGFTHAAHLVAEFRRHVKISPGEYRKQSVSKNT